MAYFGSRRGPDTDNDDDDGDEKESGVPPPPSYEEAVLRPSGAGKAQPERSELPPLSRIDKYTTSWLFPLMMRLKTTLQGVRKQVKSMEENSGSLGQEIKELNNRSYLGFLELSKRGRVGSEEGGPLADDVKSLLNAPPFLDDGSSPSMRYYVLKSDLKKLIKPVQSWVQDQLTQDRDWSLDGRRLPSISNFEIRDLKSCMMKVESTRSSVEDYRRSHPREMTIVDYATDSLLKMDLEYLWSFLVRMGDDEIGENDQEEEEEKESEEDVPEEDAERLRKKRVEYYTKGKPSGGSKEDDDEQVEGMLNHPDEDASPAQRPDQVVGDGDTDDEEAKDSIATGGMATVSNMEEERLRNRRLELYRQDSNRHGGSDGKIAEEIEMTSRDGLSASNVEVEVASLPRSHSPDSYDLAIDAGRWRDEGSGRYSPRHSVVTGEEPPEHRSRVQRFEIDEPDAEAGRRRRGDRNRYDVGSMPIPGLRTAINTVVGTKDRWPHWSNQKRLIVVFSILFVVGCVLLVSLLPASFVYVDYHEMGFVYNKVTQQTDIDRVYDFGCYLLAPQHSLVLFPATAHFLDLKLQVMNKAGLTIGLDVYLQYLLRPNELSQMYRKYQGQYEKIVSIMAESTVKNMAIEFSMDEYRLNRSMVESSLFHRLKRVLSGDCCNSDNDRFKRFQTSIPHILTDSHNNDTSTCNENITTCDHGYHIDLAFFQLGDITIPSEVMSHYLKQITLKLETEKELYKQDKAVVEKQTTMSVLNITNRANEIKSLASAEKVKIEMLSKASRLKMKEESYAASLKKTFDLLKISEEEEKTSLLFLNTLKNIKDNLVAFSYNYDKETVLSP